MLNKVEQTKPAQYMNPLLAGILLGMILLATFVVTGHGLECMSHLLQQMQMNTWVE